MPQVPQQALADTELVAPRAAQLLEEHQQKIWRRTDRLFASLLVFEWLLGIAIALWRSRLTWSGADSSVHPHVYSAAFLGGVIITLPILLAWRRPGAALTRHVIATAQMLVAALLIHIADGRIEMHFQIFGSLAFLAFYRDWRVLITASLVISADHLFRGFFMPESIYGASSATIWRTLEHAVWVLFEDLFLITACRQGVQEMRGIAQNQALLEHSHQTVEETVRQRTSQLKNAQADLLKVARSAGMAEIATAVLHNVGNVLNSVNVSVSVATSRVTQSPVANLTRAVALMKDHAADLGDYLTTDQRGRQIPQFLGAVAEALSVEQNAMLEEMASLSKNVDHIKQIISVQQTHAKVEDLAENIDIAALLNDAINVTALSAVNVDIVREFAPLSDIRIDKHVVLQILINLLSNAKYAVMENAAERRTIILRASLEPRNDHSRLIISVIDNGSGIAPENLTRIFNHGFTTKRDGHGFGLHAAANSLKQLGGKISVHSDGVGKGAAFTLELPILSIAQGVPA